MLIPSPTGPPSTPDFSVVPTGPPRPPDGWLPGQPVVRPVEPVPTPWWGMADILLGVAFIVGAVIAATIVGLVIGGVDTSMGWPTAISRVTTPSSSWV